MTLASVVISAGVARPSAARSSTWLSTSPLRAAATYGRPADPVGSSLLRGWALASLMMPTLAQRVWPSTVTSASAAARATAEEVVAGDGGPQDAATLSPSSPISAAAL